MAAPRIEVGLALQSIDVTDFERVVPEVGPVLPDYEGARAGLQSAWGASRYRWVIRWSG
jgi:hypothetical protein